MDLETLEPAVLTRLLWVCCQSADEALKVTDLLLRDRNLPRVVVDLKLCSPTELRRLSSSGWHRFHRLTEHQGTTALIITPQPLVSGATCRVRVASHLNLAMLSLGPDAVKTQLRFEVLRTPASRAVRSQQATG